MRKSDKCRVCTPICTHLKGFADLGFADLAFATFEQILPLVHTLLHMSKFKEDSFFRPVNSTRKGCTLGTSSSSAW